MSQALTAVKANHWEWTSAPDEMYEDSSPFGLQGLARGSLQIIKPDCINRLAIRLALHATPSEIQDSQYVDHVLSRHSDWLDEYQVVHLIEKSLWIQGRSDLVMTMTRNPSQIPDNPPAKIKQALSRAYTLHPRANIWYGVPLFGDQTNDEGLPIPVTASEVRAEARRRIEAAQEIALRWGWLYRMAMAIARVPLICWHGVLLVRNRLKRMKQGMSEYWGKCRQDARRRARAIYMADLEMCRHGYTLTEVPEHRTWLGRILETAIVLFELASYQVSDVGSEHPFLNAVATPIALLKISPLLFVPISLLSCDPFLFVELPEEPGKLRHLGHWYWQDQEQGQKKLHLHV